MKEKTSPSNVGVVVSGRGTDKELFDVISGFETRSKQPGHDCAND